MKVVVVAAALLAAPALAADKEKIAIVDLDAPSSMLGLSSQVTKSIINEAMKTKRGIITPDEVREKLGNKAVSELTKCADQAPCAADKLAVLGATKAIIGRLNRDDKNYVLQLWFLDLNELALITAIDRSILIASRRFQKDVEAAVPGFLRGEREAHGTLTVNATTANAQVTINGEFMGVAPLTTTLKPGKYELRVEKPKFLPVKRLVSVEANQKTVEEVRMLLIPGQKEDDLAPMAAGPKPEVAGGSSGGSTFAPSAPTIVFGVAALASAGIALGFGVVSKNQYDDLKKGYDSASDSYAGTREQALAAQRNATGANISWGVAGAALIATVVSVVLDVRAAKAGDTQVEVTPAPTPGGGGALLIGGRF
ncbi:MAG: PEGA domain-containing protein [Archangiaceae bacterium]|nr:PEGA domain-containing protein [Archangiaceae bacterium]